MNITSDRWTAAVGVLSLVGVAVVALVLRVGDDAVQGMHESH